MRWTTDSFKLLVKLFVGPFLPVTALAMFPDAAGPAILAAMALQVWLVYRA